MQAFNGWKCFWQTVASAAEQPRRADLAGAELGLSLQHEETLVDAEPPHRIFAALDDVRLERSEVVPQAREAAAPAHRQGTEDGGGARGGGQKKWRGRMGEHLQGDGGISGCCTLHP